MLTETRTLVRALNCLTIKELVRVQIHYLKKTKFLCGKKSNLFTDGKGGACLTVCSLSIKIPHHIILEGDAWFPACEEMLDRFTAGTRRYHYTYQEALANSNIRTVRSAIHIALRDRGLWTEEQIKYILATIK